LKGLRLGFGGNPEGRRGDLPPFLLCEERNGAK